MLIHMFHSWARRYLSIFSILREEKETRRRQKIIRYHNLQRMIAHTDNGRFGRSVTPPNRINLRELIPQLMCFGACEGEIIVSHISSANRELISFDHAVGAYASSAEAFNVYQDAIWSGELSSRPPSGIAFTLDLPYEVDSRTLGHEALLHVRVEIPITKEIRVIELFVRGQQTSNAITP